MIELQDIKPVPIFDDQRQVASDIWACSRSFEKGRVYLISAPSGKGKSTLLHIIYGLRNDFEGQVHLNQKETAAFVPDDWSDWRQNKLSIVFQDLRLFPELTARENIMLNNGLAQHKTMSEIETMAKQLGVFSLLDKKTQTLSYGQRQRMSIIRALCQPFDFLLLDEPFSHLDEENINIARQLIEVELKAQGAGLLLVSLGDSYGFQYDEKLLL